MVLAVGPAGDAVTSQETIDFKKLSGLPLVLPGLPSGLRVRLEQNGRKAGTTLNIVLEVEALNVMKEGSPAARSARCCRITPWRRRLRKARCRSPGSSSR
jgi:hypothetical protein